VRGSLIPSSRFRARKVTTPGMALWALAAGSALLAGCGREAAAPSVASVDQHWDLLNRYCTDCHNRAEMAGDLSLQGLTPDHIAANPALWEKVIMKVRGDHMPPPGSAKPTLAVLDAFATSLEHHIDGLPGLPPAGHVGVQRMTRTEYASAVEDLLAVRIDPAEFLPTEIEVDGFTNIAAALSVSPAFLEQYVSVARYVARTAVGEPVPRLSSAWYPPPADDQDSFVDGMPLGTRGGTSFHHVFPADGEYRFTLTDLDVGLYPRALEAVHTVVLLIDRNEVFRTTLGGPEDLALVNRGGAPARAELMERFTNIPVHVQAGRREVVVAFVERSRVATEELVYGFTPYGGFSFRGELRVPRILGGIEVTGPFDSTGISSTASRERIFVCEPSTVDDERACAENIAAHLARRAFRRPVDEADIARLMPFFETGREEGPGGFDSGIEHLVTAVLASPDFLYRAVQPPREPTDEHFHALTALELASRLSFFLWSQGPDDELLELATSGRLQDPAVLEAQARRMLLDPRADALIDGFALRWLHLDNLAGIVPDQQIFPGFSDELREDFDREIGLFLRSILLADRDVRELITAEHTYLNERLARHYGIDSVHGPQFRRVTLADETRHGLLGKAAVLLATSYGDRTSPVLRGAWVLEKLIGAPPAPPPPEVEADLTTPDGALPTTIRARLEQHREDPSCGGCHAVIDPYGIALENFSAIGEWREFDRTANAPIDSSTELPNGVSVTGPVELREALTARPEQFVRAMTDKLLMYALGRELAYHDKPQVRAIVRAAADEGYTLTSLVAGIVTSDAFRLQALPDADSGSVVASSIPDAAAAAIVSAGTVSDRQASGEH
jgi:hypothetical protein